MVPLLFIWLTCGVLAVVVASSRGHDDTQWVVSSPLLGPLGILRALLTPENEAVLEQRAIALGEMTACTRCGRGVKPGRVTCPYCGTRQGRGKRPENV